MKSSKHAPSTKRKDCDAVGVRCALFPAAPKGLLTSASRPRGGSIRETATHVILENDFVGVEISRTYGMVTAIIQKNTGQRHLLDRDQTGFAWSSPSTSSMEWMAAAGNDPMFSIRSVADAHRLAVTFTAQVAGCEVSLNYGLRRDAFWVERTHSIRSHKESIRLQRQVYGNLQMARGQRHALQLGRFDRPCLIAEGSGGVFGGVAWWFYEVDAGGMYQNSGMDYAVEGSFCSEPWYLGVFVEEEGDPYPGWMWYKNFLQTRKAAYDRQTSWSFWNLGWGQWGVDVNDPTAPAFLEMARRLGLQGVGFGGGYQGKGIQEYVRLAHECETTQHNLARAHDLDLSVGFLDQGSPVEIWTDSERFRTRQDLLKEYARQGMSAIHFDFFKTEDTFVAHRRVAEYFRAARGMMSYTECHLGMALYGPQLQREVLVNHPADIEGFDIAHFSSDWATFLGFRHSRRVWQRQYQYLMSEYGLYYFLTHYLNAAGDPRRYTDPEPQQFLSKLDCFTGISFNFHDAMGFRTAVMASAAFTTFSVFGHLEMKMPERDVLFARSTLEWIRQNAEVLRWGRVCMEDEEACVVSKICDGKGAVFLINYGLGSKTFDIELKTGVVGTLRARQVYPIRGEEQEWKDGEKLKIRLWGESVAIFNVNDGLKTLPPENKDDFHGDLGEWTKVLNGYEAHFVMPDIREALNRRHDPTLPQELLSFDEMGHSSFPLEVEGGKLPQAFREAMGFRDEKHIATWRCAPWAFADRVWLVWRPDHPPHMSALLPKMTINGHPVELVRRINARTKDLSNWNCPVCFSDITKACHYGGDNIIRISEWGTAGMGKWCIRSVTDEPPPQNL